MKVELEVKFEVEFDRSTTFDRSRIVHHGCQIRLALFEEFVWFELSKLDQTPFPKYLDMDQERENLNFLNKLIFAIANGKRYSFTGANIKQKL